MSLTDSAVRALKPQVKAYRRSDGGGLYVEVTSSGSKLWRMAYRFAGKQKTLSFGTYPAVSLADARRKRDDAKSLLADGRDPSVDVRVEKQNARIIAGNTFALIAKELVDKNEREGKAPVTLKKKVWLLGMAKRSFGPTPISEIKAADILVPLKNLENRGKYETAHRLRAVIGQVFRYAIATGRAEYDPTFGLRGALIAHKVQHQAAIIDDDGFGRLIGSIWTYTGSPNSVAALKLMSLLYPRPGELRQAEWSEFDLEKAIWTIPADRTKMRREHTKPLSTVALQILKNHRAATTSNRLVFPAMTSVFRPMSENTMNQALRRMGYGKDEMTSHGFRASASSLLNESGLWQEDAIEAELAHVGNNQVRKAYHRAQYWEERVRMAEWWGEYLMGQMKNGGLESLSA